MGLRALLASTLITFGSTQSHECEPLDYYWPHAPFEVRSHEIDPGLEERVIVEQDKIPGPIRALIRWHEPRPQMIITYDPPIQVSWFSDLDPDRLNVVGRRTRDSAAFVTRWHESGQMVGYYNPERVAQTSASQNAILHEYGHIAYRALAIPTNEILLEEFRAASAPFRPRIEHHYPQNDLSEEAYEALILDETFAEAFAYAYAHEKSENSLRSRYHELAAFMDRMETHAIALLEEHHGFDYERRCELAHLINPSGWEPQTILNISETPE